MRTKSAILLIPLALFLASFARADTVWIAGTGQTPIPFSEVTVLRIDADQLVFRTFAGVEASRPLHQVTRLEIDGATLLNTAEQHYAAGRWSEAADSYQQALRGREPQWRRLFAALRLIDAAGRAARYDAAVSAFISLAAEDADLAARNRPDIPSHADPGVLQTLADQVERALSANPPRPQQHALLALLLELHRARGDAPAAALVAQRLLPLVEDHADDPAAARALAELRLSLAQLALDQHNHQQARDEIQANRALFVEPAHQAAALFLLAEAQHALANQNDDPDALKDAALNYMRVVAHFAEAPGRPYVPDSLLRTAEIHEKLDETAAAIRLYQQVASQFPDHPARLAANQNLQRLRPGE